MCVTAIVCAGWFGSKRQNLQTIVRDHGLAHTVHHLSLEKIVQDITEGEERRLHVEVCEERSRSGCLTLHELSSETTVTLDRIRQLDVRVVFKFARAILPALKWPPLFYATSVATRSNSSLDPLSLLCL